MNKNVFQFKQFAVRQDRCAMKVGTDGVLIGAWAKGGNNILDIGTGTGIIAMMMAQRYPQAMICGLDIDADACLQATENIVAAEFASRITICNTALQQHNGTYDAIVSNPPYSVPWDGDSDATLINDPRFSPAGVLAPRSKADFAFTMHMLSWLSTEGTAAIIEFPGVLYRGGAEQKIRQYLVRNNYVDTVIQLPQNLFFGTSIATCIIVLKKNKPDNRVCFIDASNEFIHEGNKNKLSDENIRKIYETQFNKTEVEYFSKVVTTAEIEAQKFNLSVSTYVEKEDTSVEIDIDELNQRIAQIVARQNVLRTEIDELVKTL